MKGANRVGVEVGGEELGVMVVVHHLVRVSVDAVGGRTGAEDVVGASAGRLADSARRIVARTNGRTR